MLEWVDNRGNRQYLEATVECRMSKGWKKAKALIDSGAQLNLVSQLFVKEARWQLCPKGASAVETMDGQEI